VKKMGFVIEMSVYELYDRGWIIARPTTPKSCITPFPSRSHNPRHQTSF
jgi:hypothetical protein